jgi:hypothetical protein
MTNDSPPATQHVSFADEITRLSDTIRACDRLCLLGARTVVRCALPIADTGSPPAPIASPPEDNAAIAFIPTVTRDLKYLGDYGRDERGAQKDSERFRDELESATPLTTANRHPTTSAQCIAALQALLPVVGRFRLGTHESRDLPFHPIEKSTLKIFEPRAVTDAVRPIIDKGIAAFRAGGADSESAPLAAGARERGSGGILMSTSFQNLHPFTAVQALRAIAPSQALFKPVWWRSLFVILWFLNRRGGSLRGHPNTQATKCPGTAFLTSKCVDAVEVVYGVFERRRERFQSLIKLIEDLQNTHEACRQIEGVDCISSDLFCAAHKSKANILLKEIYACIAEIAADTSIELYQTWQRNLPKLATAPDDYFVSSPDDPHQAPAAIANAFIEAVKTHSCGLEEAKASAVANLNHIETFEQTVKWIAASVDALCASERLDNRTSPAHDVKALPNWLCSDNYWAATWTALFAMERFLAGAEAPAPSAHLQNLQNHWHRHREAARNAITTMNAFSRYMERILGGFKQLQEAAADPANKPAGLFLNCLKEAAEHLFELRQQLWRGMEAGVKWAEVLMNRHMAHAASGSMAQFDACELAHAMRVYCRHADKVRFDLMRTALHAVCAAQRADGTWGSQQPFYWTDMGLGASTLSVETAWAVVATVNEILKNPERFGASLDDIVVGFAPVYAALDRFFRWLSSGMQSFPTPRILLRSSEQKDPGLEIPLYGWCSDRVHEPGRIHSWVTAIAIEFLVDFRRLLQERINTTLRAEFESHHPSELGSVLAVAPTDLEKESPKNKGTSTIADLMAQLREHKTLQFREGPWLPSEPPRADISLWSAVMYGPPGTSKTFLTKAIAGELGWPLISLSPSDFLTKGDANIEARAKEIFTALGAGSRMVYFFDEFDELIRARRGEGDPRNVFSLLTPSFLTKLQGLRDAAKSNEFIFVLGTNYFDRIDSAAKRSGRIDRQFLISYPDEKSRAGIILEDLLKRSKAEDIAGQFEDLRKYLNKLQRLLGEFARHSGSPPAQFLKMYVEFTGFLSYTTIKELNKCLPADPEKKNQLEVLIDHLRAIDRGKSTRFRPEIKLVDYADRPDPWDEVEAVADVIPTEPFPLDEASGARESQLKEQLVPLLEAARENKKLLDNIRKKYGPYLTSP